MSSNEKTNQENNTNQIENPEINKIEETKPKFNLLEQGKKMLISSDPSSIENIKNLIIIGPKSSGKSTIFNFLSTGEASSSNFIPTSGINYGFMRYQKSKNKSSKKIVNIYEIGNGIENLNLIKTIINNKNIENTIFFLILDFADPQNILNEIFKFMKELKNILTESIENDILNEIIKFKDSQYSKYQKAKEVNLFPANLYLIGNKYDILEKIDAEKIKWVGLTLRYFSYINGVNLIFYSNFSEKNRIILQSTIENFGFGVSKIDNIKNYVQKNELNPLYISFYNDSLEEIGQPRVMEMSGKNVDERWIETYKTIFKNFVKENKENKNIQVDKNLWEKYKENRIDNEIALFEKAKENENKKNKNKISIFDLKNNSINNKKIMLKMKN
jgi:hypothetical protein